MKSVLGFVIRGIEKPLGYFLGILWFDILRIRRNIIFENLERAFPGMSLKEKKRIGRQSCICMGLNFAEILQIPFLTKNDTDRFVYIGLENFDAAKAKGRGVCVLSLHLGNGDFSAAGLALIGYNVNIISKEFKIKWLNDLWFSSRKKIGTKFIPPRNSTRQILKALKNNETVVFVQDQFMGPPRGAKTTFFGHVTGTAMGLAVIASRAKSPVIMVHSYRKNGKTYIECSPEIPFEEKGGRDESLVHNTQIYSDSMERVIREHPEQWMWVHRRWKPYYG